MCYCQKEKGLRDLRNASRLYHGGPALALCEARRFVFVGVNAAELFAVGVIHADQPMVMFAAAVPGEGVFVFGRCFFCHFARSLSEGSARHYLKELVAAQVPMEILTRYLLHQKISEGETRNMIDMQIAGSPSSGYRVWRHLRISSVWMRLSLLEFCGDCDDKAAKGSKNRLSLENAAFCAVARRCRPICLSLRPLPSEQIVVTHETFSAFFRLSR